MNFWQDEWLDRGALKTQFSWILLSHIIKRPHDSGIFPKFEREWLVNCEDHLDDQKINEYEFVLLVLFKCTSNMVKDYPIWRLNSKGFFSVNTFNCI